MPFELLYHDEVRKKRSGYSGSYTGKRSIKRYRKGYNTRMGWGADILIASIVKEHGAIFIINTEW